MRLYHFVADHMLESVLSEGLTLGSICWIENGSLHRLQGWQWLTCNPNRDQQEWCNPEFSNLPYDRCANRITLSIPKTAREQLRDWVSVGPLLVPREYFDFLNAYGKPEEYKVFNGRIPPAWFRSVQRIGARWNRMTAAVERASEPNAI